MMGEKGEESMELNRAMGQKIRVGRGPEEIHIHKVVPKHISPTSSAILSKRTMVRKENEERMRQILEAASGNFSRPSTAPADFDVEG
ncbi:unnamed protein product [Notodromas monacha]|uniref:Uncharacterized protein n=1 Tax=Notodromas monacha TaxID=399045 RepID=A0A7R9GAW4_9CRUS|nr:unnamed protein product [Notodromas monacha]CAG0914420.1 unnamed protein product [Notodromas monacha]